MNTKLQVSSVSYRARFRQSTRIACSEYCHQGCALTLNLCLQAVPVAQVHSYSQLYPQQAVFALDEGAGRLYAAGGAAASTVHTWDMSQERCIQQVDIISLQLQLRVL